MSNIIEKCSYFGNDNIMLCERGSSFGYNNLIVDFLGVSELKETQKKALIQAFKNRNISYREFIINKKAEESIGELFAYFMLETALIGNIIGIDPFNQPAVEEVKILTKRYLS